MCSKNERKIGAKPINKARHGLRMDSDGVKQSSTGVETRGKRESGTRIGHSWCSFAGDLGDCLFDKGLAMGAQVLGDIVVVTSVRHIDIGRFDARSRTGLMESG